MREYSFSNQKELDTFLDNIDISVPSRSKGRKTEHTEMYTIISFLKEFHNKEEFSFPFTLTHRDKPDFLITSQTKKIGIEFTESIPKQLAKATYLLEKHFECYAKLEPEFFGWDAPERTDNEILEILKKSQERLIGQGFVGKSIEIKWILGIKGCINKKTKKLNNSEFEIFENNYLLIYDNQTKPMLDKNYIVENLFPFLKEYWNENIQKTFDKVFIDSGEVFLVITKELTPKFNIVAKKDG